MSYSVSSTGYYDKLRKAAITGGVGWVAGYVFGETGPTQLAGFNVSMPVALGASTALGSLAADVAHDWVLPYVPGNDKFSNAEAAVLGVGVSGGVATYVLNGGEVLNTQSFNTFLLGAGSYAGGEWIDKKFFQAGSNGLGYF